jgi:hypothetical protein
MNTEQLRAAGYRPLTHKLRIPEDDHFLARQLLLLRRGKIPYHVVWDDGSNSICEVWSVPRVSSDGEEQEE